MALSLTVGIATAAGENEEPSGIGRIRYDPPGSGTFSGGVPGPVIGNLFDTHLGSPLVTGTIYWVGAQITGFPYYGGTLWVAGPVSGSAAPFVTALPLTRTSGSLAVADIGPIPITPPFLVGFRANLAQALFVAAGTTQGQGTHGRFWYGGYAGSSATQIQALPTAQFSVRNAAIRVGGSVATIPVELLEFDLD